MVRLQFPQAKPSKLGFFSLGDSKNRYLGIWYKNFPHVIVWVANRENPVTDSHGVLTIANDGNLVLLNQANTTIWLSNSLRVAEDPVVQLLETGNLVLRDKSDENPESYIWQSFNFPCDTLLSRMKMGCNFHTGENRRLTAWKNASDPSLGDFTFGIEIIGLPQFVLLQRTEKKYCSGLYNGHGFSGSPVMRNPVMKYIFVYNTDELYYTDDGIANRSILTRYTLNQSGLIQRLVLEEGSAEWEIMYTVQNDPCDEYGRCGANGFCRTKQMASCDCLKGFIPKSQKEWDVHKWSSGCVRRTPLDCQKGDGFIPHNGVKLPDLLEFWVNKSMNIKECKAMCSKNCSCTAFANSDINGDGSGCVIWFGDLIDIHEYVEVNTEQYISIRMPALELELLGNSGQGKKRIAILVVVSTVSGMLFSGVVCWCIIQKKRRKKKGLETKKEDFDLPLFDLATTATATSNFSFRNVVGEGGFGPVYKGELSMGQEIAVKRLLKNSRQGVEEFINEVKLIAKLQHGNLVRLLGCCIEGEERMLIYEYMPNKSLDYFIFDEKRSASLAWQKRFDIIMGTARGLLYLHQDSRLRIVHRDLKTSNILPDSELNPKISDFSLARIVRGDQIEAKTESSWHIVSSINICHKRVLTSPKFLNLVILCSGYISPEYAIDGKFSVKSDIFSLGVLLLEMVNGKKKRGFYHLDHHHNLLGHAWMLWNEDQALELMDPCLEDSYIKSQVLRCIQVGLFCVQKLPKDRPAISSVVSMLGTEGAILPQPKQPGFFIERSSIGIDDTRGEIFHTQNSVSVTILEAR